MEDTAIERIKAGNPIEGDFFVVNNIFHRFNGKKWDKPHPYIDHISTRTKSIDNVTTDILDVALRASDIKLPIDIIDKIIDIVELIEEKGNNTNIQDIHKLQTEWEK